MVELNPSGICAGDITVRAGAVSLSWTLDHSVFAHCVVLEGGLCRVDWSWHCLELFESSVENYCTLAPSWLELASHRAAKRYKQQLTPPPLHPHTLQHLALQVSRQCFLLGFSNCVIDVHQYSQSSNKAPTNTSTFSLLKATTKITHPKLCFNSLTVT